MLALRFPNEIPAGFPMPLSICEPHAWYLVVTCKNCGERQPIHRDPTKGQGALLRTYTWRCVHCDYLGTYEPHEIERYQHRARRPADP